jgi:flagellar hook-length control protein FliK
MRTKAIHRLRVSAIVFATISICMLASACRSAGTATAHANPVLSATPASATAADSTAPDASTPGPTETDASTSAATATAGAAVAGGCLISPQEAATAFGHSVGAGSGNASTCTYQTAGGILTVFATGYGDNAMAAFTAQRGAATALPGFHDVNGVGDHAFVNLDDPMSLIELISGSTVVIIQVGISPAPPVTVMTTLGQAAAGRI